MKIKAEGHLLLPWDINRFYQEAPENLMIQALGG